LKINPIRTPCDRCAPSTPYLPRDVRYPFALSVQIRHFRVVTPRIPPPPANAPTLSGAVDRDRRKAAEAQQREQLAAERARAMAQERQQGREREQVAERFRTIAVRREAGAHGYGDHNSDWRATPEALRKAVDAYNGADQHTKDLYIERIQREPQMARAVGQLLHDRELVLQRGLGLSR